MPTEITNRQSYPIPDVLVAIMNNRRDFEIATKESWYRIPVKNADCLIPYFHEMKLLAFYQTQIFKQEAYAVNYSAKIENIAKVRRIDLLPDQAGNENRDELYYKLEISPLQRLSRPIPSQRLRRVTFITTTIEKFRKAQEINDLFHTSPLEDRMWYEIKAAGIAAERQYEIRERGANYNLDFAIECNDGYRINIECNGDTYHSTKAARNRDRRRNTYLTTHGWLVQRFGTDDIQKNLSECIDKIRKLIDRHGGPIARGLVYDLYRTDADSQLNLF